MYFLDFWASCTKWKRRQIYTMEREFWQNVILLGLILTSAHFDGPPTYLFCCQKFLYIFSIFFCLGPWLVNQPGFLLNFLFRLVGGHPVGAGQDTCLSMLQLHFYFPYVSRLRLSFHFISIQTDTVSSHRLPPTCWSPSSSWGSAPGGTWSSLIYV